MADNSFAAALPSVLQRLQSTDPVAMEGALSFLCEFVARCSANDGLALGAALRETGAIMRLSQMVGDESIEVVTLALLLLSNLASDAVDASSGETKQMLLQCGTEYRLLPLLEAPDEDIMIYTCALLPNMSNDAGWASLLFRQGADVRLQELASLSAEPLVRRYALGAINNLLMVLPESERHRLSDEATAAVGKRAAGLLDVAAAAEPTAQEGALREALGQFCDEQVEKLTRELAAGGSAQRKPLRLALTVDKGVPLRPMIIISDVLFVLHELLSNAFKHGAADTQVGVRVHSPENQPQMLAFEVINGPGAEHSRLRARYGTDAFAALQKLALKATLRDRRILGTGFYKMEDFVKRLGGVVTLRMLDDRVVASLSLPMPRDEGEWRKPKPAMTSIAVGPDWGEADAEAS